MVYTYKEWMTMNGAENAEKANEILEEKIRELLEKNGYKNDYGPGMFHISDLNHDVTVKPIGGTIAEVKIKKLNYYSESLYEEEIVRIHPDECFYAEDYVLCDADTRLAHAVLNVVNKVYGKEGELT